MTEEQILEKLKFILVYHLAVEPSDITMDADLSYDLGGDSMTLYNIRYELHKEFGISYPYSVQEQSEYVENEIHTVGDVVEFIKRKLYGAQPATKVADKTVATKTQTDTKSKPDVQITITNVPNGKEKPTVLNCGTITDAQKQDFLAAISEHKPSDGDNHTCGFNVYYAKQSAMRVVPYDMPTDFQPVKKKIGKNELIVEMIPMSKKECGSWANYHCPICLASGDCTSPFIRKYIGALLFPDKYAKQR